MNIDNHSTTEHDAERAEHFRAESIGLDLDDQDNGQPTSTWTLANIPQHVWDDVANAPTDGPPF